MIDVLLADMTLVGARVDGNTVGTKAFTIHGYLLHIRYIATTRIA